jgi:hypothetical protein
MLNETMRQMRKVVGELKSATRVADGVKTRQQEAPSGPTTSAALSAVLDTMIKLAEAKNDAARSAVPDVEPRNRVGSAHGRPKGNIHRVDPDFGSTFTASNRDSQSNCWVNWKIMGLACEFQVLAADGTKARPKTDGIVIITVARRQTNGRKLRVRWAPRRKPPRARCECEPYALSSPVYNVETPL